MENFLSRYQELLGRLNKSKAKQRRGGDGNSPALTIEALRKEQEALREERRKGIKSDFVDTMPKINFPLPGAVRPPSYSRDMQPIGGSIPPKSSTRIDESDPRYQSMLEHFKKNPPQMGLFPIKDEKPSYKQIPEKTPTAFTNPNLTKDVLDRMANF
jgi:hypothetical protein